jgi:CDP-diglyceride synthetase
VEGVSLKKFKKLKFTSPTLAAVLNFFLWGSGYLLNGKRKLLGVALMLFVWVSFSSAFVYVVFPSLEVYYAFAAVFYLSLIFVSFAFARDAYQDAKRKGE